MSTSFPGSIPGDLWFRTPAGVWHAPVPESGIRTVTGVPAGLVWGCMGPALLPAGGSLTMNCPGEPVVPEGSPRWAARIVNRYSSGRSRANATFVDGSTVVPVTTDAKGSSLPARTGGRLLAHGDGRNQTEPWTFTGRQPESGNFYG
ncbi:MAG: hypothetical protein IPF66_16330 [Holophagales bacterium]|nr:hypothetical protein [Holophagales bacterium]